MDCTPLCLQGMFADSRSFLVHGFCAVLPLLLRHCWVQCASLFVFNWCVNNSNQVEKFKHWYSRYLIQWLLYTWMYTTHMTHSLDRIGKTSLGMSLIRVAIHWDNYLYVKSNVNAFIHAPAYRSFPDLVCHDQPRGHWLAWGMQPGATKLESKRRQRGLRFLSSLVDQGCMPQTKQCSRTLGIFVGGKEQGESDTTGGWGTSLNVTILEGGKCI